MHLTYLQRTALPDATPTEPADDTFSPTRRPGPVSADGLDVAIAPDGDTYLSWQLAGEHRILQVAKRPAPADRESEPAPWGDPVTVYGVPWSTATRTGVRLAVGGNDTVTLAWRGTRDWREGRHVHAVVAVRDQWRHPVRFSGKGDVNAPEVVLDVAEVVHVVWPTWGWAPKRGHVPGRRARAGATRSSATLSTMTAHQK